MSKRRAVKAKRRKQGRSDTSSKAKFNVKPKKEPKKSKTGTYKEIPYESWEEQALLMWLFELKNQGIVKSIRRADSLLLSDALVNSYVIQLKTKSNNATQTILQPHSYTAEFIVEWYWKKARDKFLWRLGDSTKYDKIFVAHKTEDPEIVVTYIECKPSFDFHGMGRLFKVNQKFCWAVHQLYINLVKKDELFEQTFTPKEYLNTSTGKPRVVRWKTRTLFDYLSNR